MKINLASKINLSPPVALAAVCSKAVVLLLIHCSLLLPLLCGGFVFDPCFAVQYLLMFQRCIVMRRFYISYKQVKMTYSLPRAYAVFCG